MSKQSEFDRQMKIFNDKINGKPDVVIKAHSVVRTSDNDGKDLCFWFLSDDDTVTMVDMREDEDGNN